MNYSNIRCKFTRGSEQAELNEVNLLLKNLESIFGSYIMNTPLLIQLKLLRVFYFTAIYFNFINHIPKLHLDILLNSQKCIYLVNQIG